MKKLPRLTALAAASVLAFGSVACSDNDSNDESAPDNGSEENEEPDDHQDGTDDEDGSSEDVIEALVGIWEADPE